MTDDNNHPTMKQIMIKTSDLVNSDLWRLFPAINVDKTKDIPCDYPGPMGVPITAWDKLCLDRRFQRFIIRNLKPDLPEEVDLADMLRRSGSKYEIILEPFNEKRKITRSA